MNFKRSIAKSVIVGVLGLSTLGLGTAVANAAPAPAAPAISAPAMPRPPQPAGPNWHAGRVDDHRGDWRSDPRWNGQHPWGWGAPPPPAWNGPLPPADGPAPAPFDYWGQHVTPVWDQGYNQWGFWFLGIWIPL